MIAYPGGSIRSVYLLKLQIGQQMLHIVELMDKRLIGRGAGTGARAIVTDWFRKQAATTAPPARQPKSAQQGNSQFPVLTIRGALPDAAEGQQNHICLGSRCDHAGAATNPGALRDASRPGR
jgi:hypothetical protein